MPAPTLPLTGAEIIPCIQPPPGTSGATYRACTAANIANTQGGGALLKSNNLSDLANQATALNNLSGLPHLANNTAMSAVAHSTYAVVVRDGYATAGDAPPLTFIPSATQCSLNSGAGDGGSQVPTSDGGCWIASLPAITDIREWGVVLNGSTDNATTAQNALNAKVPLFIPPVGTLRTTKGLTCATTTNWNCIVYGVQGASGIELDDSTLAYDALTIGVTSGGCGLGPTTFNHTISGIAFSRAQASTTSAAITLCNANDDTLSNNTISQSVANFAYAEKIVSSINVTSTQNYFTQLGTNCFNISGGAPQAQISENFSTVNDSCQFAPTGLLVGNYAQGIFIQNDIFFECSIACVSFSPQASEYSIEGPATVTAGGTGYTNGMVITLGNATSGVTNRAPVRLTVTNASGGVIQAGGVSILDAGMYDNTANAQTPLAGFSASSLGTWTTASTSPGGGAGATFTFPASLNFTNSAKIRNTDLDTGADGLYIQYYNQVLITSDFFAGYTSFGLVVKGATDITCCGSSLFLGTAVGAVGIGLGGASATATVARINIADYTMNAGSAGIVMSGFANNIAIGCGTITNMGNGGITQATSNVSNVNVCPSMTFSGNTNGDFELGSTWTFWASPNFVYSVAGTPLPTCNGAAASQNFRALVSDASSATPTFAGSYTGSGSTPAPVVCTSSGWKYG